MVNRKHRAELIRRVNVANDFGLAVGALQQDSIIPPQQSVFESDDFPADAQALSPVTSIRGGGIGVVVVGKILRLDDLPRLQRPQRSQRRGGPGRYGGGRALSRCTDRSGAIPLLVRRRL